MSKKRKRKETNKSNEVEKYEPAMKKRKLSMDNQSDIFALLKELVEGNNRKRVRKLVRSQIPSFPPDNDQIMEFELPSQVDLHISKMKEAFLELKEKEVNFCGVGDCYAGGESSNCEMYCSCHDKGYRCGHCDDADGGIILKGLDEVESCFRYALEVCEEEENYDGLLCLVEAFGEGIDKIVNGAEGVNITEAMEEADGDYEEYSKESILGTLRSMCEDLSEEMVNLLKKKKSEKSSDFKDLVEVTPEYFEPLKEKMNACEELSFDSIFGKVFKIMK